MKLVSTIFVSKQFAHCIFLNFKLDNNYFQNMVSFCFAIFKMPLLKIGLHLDKNNFLVAVQYISLTLPLYVDFFYRIIHIICKFNIDCCWSAAFVVISRNVCSDTFNAA